MWYFFTYCLLSFVNKRHYVIVSYVLYVHGFSEKKIHKTINMLNHDFNHVSCYCNLILVIIHKCEAYVLRENCGFPETIYINVRSTCLGAKKCRAGKAECLSITGT